MISYAKKYKTTLSEDIEAVAREGYGKNARPILLEKKDVMSLIEANCRQKDTFMSYIKMLSV